jgi:glycosyltransferase involved in cell wall biosynthesis
MRPSSLAALLEPGVHPPARPAPPLPVPWARPLSVLHLITRLERGGSSDCTLLQAIGTARRGHRVTIASGPTDAPSPLLAAASGERRLRLVRIEGLSREPGLGDLRALAAIVRLLRAEPYDIIHTHTSKAGALGRVAAALLGRRRAVVHQPHGHLFYGYYGRTGTALLIFAERLLARLARAQIVLSWRGAEEHLSRGIGRPGEFRVIRSGIDLRPFRRCRSRRADCRARLGYTPDDLVVGSLCRLEPVKGAEDLVRGFLAAARTRPRLRLFLGGDGPLRERLVDLADASGLRERVAISGAWVSPEQVLPALDIFVLASRNEGMGRALVEAMASGLAVVGSAVGGVPEVLEEGGSGLLIPPGDPQAVALAIGRLADDAGLAATLARRARARSLVFGAGRMVRALQDLYREVAG